jgi:GT2 family glycosyltransferase/glycosyltransferase involved in cell wall biosynthesis
MANAQGPSVKYACIVLPIIEWAHRFQRPQHLAAAFAADGHRVYYTHLTFAGWDAGWSKAPVRDNLWTVRLPGPPEHNRFLQPLGEDAIAACVDALLDLARAEDVGEAIVLVQQPFWAGVALALAARTGWKIVYDCMDEHDGLTALNPEIVRDERRLADGADLVVSTSRKLAAKHAATARRHLLVPNATEYAHFAEPPRGIDPLPGVTTPVIGYYGAIMDWFDLGMVLDAATRRPDWTFVVIGADDRDDTGPLRALPNVVMPGEVAYADIPAWLHRFDVALIPFRLVPIIQATNPVKFYEYLSAGKPIVSSALPELAPYPQFHRLARNGAELVAQAEAAMATDSPAEAARRRAWASGQTWTARYQALRTAVDALWPKVAVVIVSYQNLARIRDCVESIAADASYPNLDVVVVDNASAPEVVAYLEGFCASHAGFRLVPSARNLGFAGGNNLGLSRLAEDTAFVVLLNNDTVVTAGWLQRLLRPLRDPTVGMAGPVTWPAGSANESAIPVPYSDLPGMHAFAAERARTHRGQQFDIPMLAMYCVAMRREVLDAVGPLDEAYGIGMFEDDDYAMRLRQLGLRLVCVEDAFIHHVGRASFGQLEDATYSALFKANKAIYESRWQVAWRPPTVRPALPAASSTDAAPSTAAAALAPRPARPRVSVVLVNYNGLAHLGPCLESLSALDYPQDRLEVVLVDNASADGSRAWLDAHWPNVRRIDNAENLGFSRACNDGARLATGELVAFLNNDMRVHPQWLDGLLAAMARDPGIACVGSMVMDWDGTAVEYAGRFDDVFSIAYEPLPQAAQPQYSADTYTLFVSGGAMLLDRAVFLDAGGFDPRYFMYHEDVDLCWRLWVSGKRCCFAPASIVYHRGGASSKKLQAGKVSGWGQKHLLWTVLKNFEEHNLRAMLPLLVYFLAERGRWSEESFGALLDVFEETGAALSSILSERAVVQGRRGASDEAIFAACGHPFAFLLRSPLFRRMGEAMAAAGVPSPDFDDPGAVAQALVGWLRAALRLRAEHAAAWQADAAEKYHRVRAFAAAAPPVAATPAGEPEPRDPYAHWPPLEERIRRRFAG